MNGNDLISRDEALAAITGAERRMDAIEAINRAPARDMPPDLARLVVAAGDLAEIMDKPDQSDGMQSRYHYDWHKVDDALARFHAIAEGKP
jgi:hypothetical protein